MTESVLAIIAGLVLFLYAVTNLSEVIQKAVGGNAQQWVLRFTSNTVSAILTGTVATVLLDSSSAVIIITIVLVNAKLLTFRQAMGIVLGANIGTTFSSQIIAADIGKYSPILLLIGFVLLIVSRSERIGNIGKIILYFGVLFFGLFTMENAVEPLKESPRFADFMRQIESPLYGSLAGAVITLIIQSSSATVGMAIVLTKKGLMSLTGGIAVMLGAELGTCSDTLIATINGSRQAIKTGLFHLMFNFLSIALGLIFFYPFVRLIEWLGSPSVERALANAHMIFNVSGVLIFVWFLSAFERLLNNLITEKT
jgi:phosphate:Na+ symporter